MNNFIEPITIRNYDLADWKYEKILEQIHNFEASLDDDHEIALRLTSFGTSVTMIVTSLGYQNPDILYFYGLVNGKKSQLIQHHQLCSKEKLLRGDFFLENIDDYNYKIAELEANYFAQLILVPHAALLGFKIMNQKQLKDICQISDKAAKRRYYEFVEWKSHINAQDEYDNHIFHLYYDFIYKRKCKKCDAGIIQRYGNYCPICGNKKTLEWGDGNQMKYPLLDTYENGKLKECPTCHNEITNIEGDFCQICGNNLVNRCINDECSNTSPLPSNARYCPQCGCQSSFYNSRLLKAWDYKEPSFISDGFMNIPDPEEPPFPEIDEELPFN